MRGHFKTIVSFNERPPAATKMRLPQNDDMQERATRFANVFSLKIETIRATVDNNSAVTPGLHADEPQSPSVPGVHTFANSRYPQTHHQDVNILRARPMADMAAKTRLLTD